MLYVSEEPNITDTLIFHRMPKDALQEIYILPRSTLTFSSLTQGSLSIDKAWPVTERWR